MQINFESFIFSVNISMNLIVVSELTYNEGLYFRYITMIAKKELEYCPVIEVEKEKEDHFYSLLKSKGWLDFVEDFVQPEWRIEGVRIDTKLNYPMTIRTNQITCENSLNILGQIKSLKSTIS